MKFPYFWHLFFFFTRDLKTDHKTSFFFSALEYDRMLLKAFKIPIPRRLWDNSMRFLLPEVYHIWSCKLF